MWYLVITKLDIHTLKKRMLPYVRDKNIWMSNDALEAGSNKTVEWLLNGHTDLLPKKLMLKKLNEVI